jgi:hypothetical protein
LLPNFRFRHRYAGGDESGEGRFRHFTKRFDPLCAWYEASQEELDAWNRAQCGLPEPQEGSDLAEDPADWAEEDLKGFLWEHGEASEGLSKAELVMRATELCAADLAADG